MFVAAAGVGNLTDCGAVSQAVAAAGIDASEVDGVGGIQNHGQNVLLPYPQQRLEVVWLTILNAGVKHLRSIDLRVGVEVLHHPLELRGVCAGDEGRGAPVVEHCSIADGVLLWRQLFQEKFSPAQAGQIPGALHGCDSSAMALPLKAAFNLHFILMEGAGGSRRRFGHYAGRSQKTHARDERGNRKSEEESTANQFHVHHHAATDGLPSIQVNTCGKEIKITVYCIESGPDRKTPHIVLQSFSRAFLRYNGGKMNGQPPARRYRFGVFELDAVRGELRRQGVRIKLHTQPLELLLLLLSQPGEIFSRDEIVKALWPEGTFVDFDHGVNSAINRIREALGDAASNPRFVETVARRGYRFIAPVELVVGEAIEASASANAARVDSETQGAETASLSLLATPAELPHAPYLLVRRLFLLLQCMYLGFYVGALANLAEIEDLLTPLHWANAIFNLLVVTAAMLIPVRVFVICAVLFQPPGVRAKLLRLWAFLVPCDLLWALSPFLLLHHINWGMALACTTLLVYAPFAQRSLVLMGAADSRKDDSLRLRA